MGEFGDFMKSVNKNKKVMVAMSGGVDSSVAAKLLVDEGWDVAGVFLHFWREPGIGKPAENKCCSARAFMDARRVCQKIGIRLYTLNFADVFKKEVVDNFIEEYKLGHTPNPCVRCNKLVKLGLLIERARKLGYDYVASGHYARSEPIPNLKLQAPKIKLYRAKDKEKDQSYFLWTLTQAQLRRLLFPLGGYAKSEVRKMAEKFGLPVAKKSESQEICFISGKSHNEFLKRYIKLKKGPIKLMKPSLTSKSEMIEVIGEHRGLPLYTIGQRRGIEIGGSGPYYAARLDYTTNTLYVVKDFDDPVLFSDELVAREVNWVAGAEPKMPLKCEAVIRYRHKPVKCEVSPADIKSSADRRKGIGKKYSVKFAEPQRAVTPGQSVVFYRKDEVLGGGIIHNS